MKPVKYILIITLILFAFVFIVNLPSMKKNNDDSSQTSETTASETMPQTTEATSSTPIMVGGDSMETTVTTKESMAIDNEWALFLINQKNTLPESYTFSLEKVYKQYEMDSRCATYMKNMIADAEKAGVHLGVVSSFRSVEYQKNLLDKEVQAFKNQGLSDDEAYVKATEGVAVPGQSEHNAGLAADILEEGNYTLSEGFEKTPEFKWLSEHANEYGFILRYPKGKQDVTGIYYEPWHYRFVGIYHATKIKESGLCLEEYMESLKQ